MIRNLIHPSMLVQAHTGYDLNQATTNYKIILHNHSHTRVYQWDLRVEAFGEEDLTPCGVKVTEQQGMVLTKTCTNNNFRSQSNRETG